jgi:hypothetical protein
MERISAVVEATCDTMWNVQLLLSMPVFEVLVKMAYSIIWVFFASYVLSNGDITGTYLDAGGHRLTGLVHTFRYSTYQEITIAFYCIGYLWGLEFITMVFKFLVSFAVATWYFQPCRTDMSKQEVSPEVWRKASRFALFNHVGSLCMGASTISLLYIVAPLGVLLNHSLNSNSRNPVLKAIASSCSCCTTCAQEMVAYVNKGAIVEMV